MELKTFLFFFLTYILVHGKTPGMLIYPDMNNVFGYIQTAETSVKNMTFLGKFQSTEDCIKACFSHTPGRCLTFTHHTPQLAGSFSSTCYGGIEDPLWSPNPEANVTSGRIMWPCESDLDCSLNGKCMLGECQCRPAWGGPRCDLLNLQPADRHSGYHNMEDGKNVSSWGGSVIRDEQGTYHMWAAEMTRHCGINSWVQNSQVVHAVSNSPTGTYIKKDVHQVPFAHEPVVMRGPNKEYVLFWVGGPIKPPLCNCSTSDGSTVPGCTAPGHPFSTFMSYSMNPNGPWSKPVKVVHDGDLNFAPVILKDGSLVGFSRWWLGNLGSRIHLVTASNWKDPSTYREEKEELWPHLPPPATEDPFMYLDGDGYIHAIFHNMYPLDIQESCGGHAYSKDGKTWVYGGRSFGNSVLFTDGGTYTFSRRERPHFVFAEDGITPVALTNGAQYGGKYGDAVYTLLQPISH